MIERVLLLPAAEAAICGRVAAARRFERLTQAQLGAKVKMTRDELANIENARVALKFWPGWHIARLLNLNQRWLATGLSPQKPFADIDLSEIEARLTPATLFSHACAGLLHSDLEFRSELAWTVRQYEASGDKLAASYEATVAEIVKTFLLRVPEHRRTEFLAHLTASLDRFLRSKK